MAVAAQRYQDDLARIKKSVEKSTSAWDNNVKRFNESKKFVFRSSINDEERIVLLDQQKPPLECNVTEAYISRLRGEFSKQQPSIEVSFADGYQGDPQLVESVSGYFRGLLASANDDLFEYNVYSDGLAGGYSAIKVWTEYESEASFDQKICVGRPYDVTMCYWDDMARKPHKGDGRYCGEKFPKRKQEIEDDYDIDLSDINFNRQSDGMSWFYTNGEEKIALLCDHYEKKQKKRKLYELADGQVLWEDEYEKFMQEWTERTQSGMELRQPPAILQAAMRTKTVICRYRFIGNTVLEYIETDYKELPIIFVDGNSVMLRDGDKGQTYQMTRPYVYQVIGAQKLKNFAIQSLANELENLTQAKWIAAKEAIPEAYKDAYINPQKANVLIFNAFKNEDPNIPLPPPQAVVRPPIPPEITNTFQLVDQTIQAILGSYDAALGINNNQLSGVAIVEAATQSNAAAMPYVVGFLNGLNQAAQIVVDLIPKKLKKATSISIIAQDGKKSTVNINQQGGIDFQYPTNKLNIKVEAGVNFSIQKSRALQQIVALMQASPMFAQFMNVEGLPILLDNLEIRGIDELKMLAEKFSQQMQQQQQMAQQAQAQAPNPMAIKQQELQLKQTDLQLKAQQIQQDAIDSERQAKIDYARLGEAQAKRHHDALDKMQDRLIDVEALDNEKKKTNAQLDMQNRDMAHKHVQQAAEHHLKTHDTLHKHGMEEANLSHQVEQAKVANQQSKGNENA